MSRTSAWTLHFAVATMALTGTWLLWIGFLAPQDPDPESFAVNEYPPWVTAAHLIVGPILVFVIGLIWREHVWQRIGFKNAQLRRSGIALCLLFAVLTLGGYVLQVSEEETLRRALGWIHAIAGVVFVLVYAAHLILRPAPVVVSANPAE